MSMTGKNANDAASKDDDLLGRTNEAEDASGELSDADVENQASTEATDPDKFQRDKAEGEDTGSSAPGR